ncbi:MAG: hypothetical protein GW795_07880 [Cyanobacteria bacterium]|nr:hypothetical protein [Cyanobacteria bacterium CG_2015-16_32_12]NCO78527.1 hypothetical protein [Cyanobacteria bacterium CG_2015-22_32_23]NCQ04724.1 hypothetical protein [Cyanobacteria bacterium CG_2015-09_32_10]NCQ41799.1 hypothetical protein [Cyanobacteria bacterium CG_2015-04_32_10]NCS85444.1 hypothetical protein [Cyanobacteria bacterium CG_2015-02_32_10]
MSKSIKKLRDDLIILNTKIQDLATNLQGFYQKYFENLTPIVNNQLILATYQICTQKYPDSFLSLSYQQRINLQTKIKKLDQIFITDLLNNLHLIEVPNNIIIQDFYKNTIDFFSSLQVIENEEILREDSVKEMSSLKDENKNNEEDLLISNDLSPENLIKFQLNIEESIEDSLTKISHRTNKYLQEAGILPNNIPNKILEMALEAEENTSIFSGAPNLLSLLIEKEDKSESLDITPIVAICLRLIDIEFNNSTLNLIRQKITDVMKNLESLDSEFQKKNQQYSILQAEFAWRSSWID